MNQTFPILVAATVAAFSAVAAAPGSLVRIDPHTHQEITSLVVTENCRFHIASQNTSRSFRE